MMNDHDTPEDPMASYLEALARDACYRVDRILKESATETTEVVYFAGTCDGAELGPYVRKRLDRAGGLGTVYRKLYEVQRRGRRFRYLPRIYDCHDAGEQLVVVMDFVEGGTLYDLVGATRPQDRFGLAARVLPALCRVANTAGCAVAGSAANGLPAFLGRPDSLCCGLLCRWWRLLWA